MQQTMRHITRLHIKDFQNHADTDLALTPGINLITGSSDSGKSAILRALNAVLHNDWPRSGSYVRKGAKHAAITVEFSDGTRIIREKSETRNAVTLETPDTAIRTYEKFGTDLPPEVVLALGSPPYDEDGGGLSYAEQLAPYFLVSLSSARLPRALSRLTGISDIEQAVEQLAADKKEAKRQADDHAKRTLALEAQLTTYTALNASLTALGDLKQRRDVVRQEADSLAHGYGLWQSLTFLERKRAELTAERDAARRQSTSAILARRTEATATQGAITKGSDLLRRRLALEDRRDALIVECQEQSAAATTLRQERHTLQAKLKESNWWCEVCDRPIPPRQPHTHFSTPGSTEEAKSV